MSATDQLIAALPAVFRADDASGRLRAFLSLVGDELDGLHDLARDFPTLASADRCDVAWLPFLAGNNGADFNHYWTEVRKRKSIREAVDRSRRRGTRSYLIQALTEAGWSGAVSDNPYPPLVLNTSGELNSASLSGQYSRPGTYAVTTYAEGAVTSPLSHSGVRLVVLDNHPAGMRCIHRRYYGLTASVAPTHCIVSDGTNPVVTRDPLVVMPVEAAESGVLIVGGQWYVPAESSSVSCAMWLFGSDELTGHTIRSISVMDGETELSVLNISDVIARDTEFMVSCLVDES